MSAPTSPIETHDDYALVQGWTPDRKTQFLDHLAQKGNVRAACARVGLSREAAYRLRRRDPLFARGWAAALVQAHDASLEVLADRAIDGVEEEVWHRGELVGTRRKYDTRLLLAHLARLDKAVEDEAAQADATRFDELLARIAGEPLPGDLESRDGVLPLDRQTTVEQSADEAEIDAGEAQAEAYEKPLDGDALEALEQARREAYQAGYLDGEARWDAWFSNACCTVDYVTGWLENDRVAPGLPGGPPLPGHSEGGADHAAFFTQDSVNSVNTGTGPG